jgi:hypothetical protein
MSNSIIIPNIKYPNKVPLQLYKPLLFLEFFSFYSPIILATTITFMSFIFQNFKGIIYLLFLLGVCVLRNYAYMLAGSEPISDTTDNVCTSIQYSQYGNSTISSFIFAFTIMYISYPMFSNGTLNVWVFTALLVYFCLDIFIKFWKKCINGLDLFLNIVSGLVVGAAIVTAMYAGGSGKHLFFNEISSNKDVCYKPSNQTFKCSVYKNGELISQY